MRVNDLRSFPERTLQRNAQGFGPAAFRLSMLPASLAYGVVMRLRRYAYDMGALRSYDLGMPVVSVGNITVGGTGKTPMVEWIARHLVQTGHRPAILSRGYGAESETSPHDEALQLERSIPEVPHYMGPDRISSARKAMGAGADCVVLDDGFQHLRLARRLNLALLDTMDPFGGGHVLPAGKLREPLSALRAADAVVLTRVDAIPRDTLSDLRSRVRKITGNAPLIECMHKPECVSAADGSDVSRPDLLAGKSVGLFCGIGNPEAFLKTVEHLGARIVAAHILPDHFLYSEAAVQKIVKDCADVDLVLTTVKDAVKMGALWPGGTPLRVLKVGIAFTEGWERLEGLLSRLWPRG